MRLIEAIFPQTRTDAVRAALEECAPTHWRIDSDAPQNAIIVRAFFAGGGAQALVDRLQGLCDREAGDWRIIVLPVEATAPPVEQKNGSDDDRNQREIALREEIYNDVSKGAALSADFFLLTFLSTVVAAIGLNADNVAAVIGAMVIAPLLGPILAVSFAAALGDINLLLRSAGNAVAGLFVGAAVAVAMGLWLELNFSSGELMSRTVIGLDSVFLALAAGAAAALSIVTGVSAALVGVMVAVALLPPAAAAGLFLGAGEFGFFSRAVFLLLVNVVCVLLSAQAVYFYKGVRPRTWFEKQKAARATKINIIVLLCLLAVIVAAILLSPFGAMPDIAP